jgi:hypothetical protein
LQLFILFTVQDDVERQSVQKIFTHATNLRANPPPLLDTRTPQVDGNTRPFRPLSLPFYLIGQTRRLCETALER